MYFALMPNQHVTNTYGVEVTLHSFLTPTLVKYDLLASRVSHLTHEEGYPISSGWASVPGLDVAGEEENSYICGQSKPLPSVYFNC